MTTSIRDYEYFKNKTLPELAKLRFSMDSPTALAQLVYEEKLMEQQDNYNKEQIELQHQKNTELVKEQVKWIKYSTLITASATIVAALLGWYLGQENQQLKEQLRLKTELLQQIELHTKNMKLDTLPLQIHDKVPSKSPNENLLHNKPLQAGHNPAR
ncbi:MAG: hypothetical protein Q7T53_10075 [Deltaproteobacteria bacterium]|nr:hypothetical protein [Deltaproteobacteria bacterium]